LLYRYIFQDKNEFIWCTTVNLNSKDFWHTIKAKIKENVYKEKKELVLEKVTVLY
jgi:hypothetical protein